MACRDADPESITKNPTRGHGRRIDRGQARIVAPARGPDRMPSPNTIPSFLLNIPPLNIMVG